MLTVIATTCVAAVCGVLSVSAPLLQQGHSNPQVLPQAPRGPGAMQLRWPGHRVEFGRGIVQVPQSWDKSIFY